MTHVLSSPCCSFLKFPDENCESFSEETKRFHWCEILTTLQTQNVGTWFILVFNLVAAYAKENSGRFNISCNWLSRDYKGARLNLQRKGNPSVNIVKFDTHCQLQMSYIFAVYNLCGFHFSTGTFFLYYFLCVFLSNINFSVSFNLVANHAEKSIYAKHSVMYSGTFPKS